MLQKHIDTFFTNLIITELQKERDLVGLDIKVDSVFTNSLDFCVMIVAIYDATTNKLLTDFLVVIKRYKNNYSCLSIGNSLDSEKNTYTFDYMDNFNTVRVPECSRILDADISKDYKFILVSYIDNYNRNRLCILEFTEDGKEKIMTIHVIKLLKTKSKEIRCSFNDMFPSITFTVASFNPNIHIGKYKYSNEEKKFILTSGRTIDHKFNKDDLIDNISLNYF